MEWGGFIRVARHILRITTSANVHPESLIAPCYLSLWYAKKLFALSFWWRRAVLRSVAWMLSPPSTIKQDKQHIQSVAVIALVGGCGCCTWE